MTKKTALFLLMAGGFIWSSCSDVVRGTAVYFSHEESRLTRKAPTVVVRTGIRRRKYKLAPEVACSVNTNQAVMLPRERVLDAIYPRSEYAAYSVYPFYPPVLTLTIDTNRQVEAINLELYTAKGYVQTFSEEQGRMLFHRRPPEISVTNELDNEFDFYEEGVPGGDVWTASNSVWAVSFREARFEVPLDAKMYYNFRPVSQTEAERLVKKYQWLRAHAVLDVNRQDGTTAIRALNLIHFEAKLDLLTQESAGWVIHYDRGQRRLRVWRTRDPLFFTNGEIFRVFHIPAGLPYGEQIRLAEERLLKDIHVEWMKPDFELIADYTFSPEAYMVIGGRRVRIGQYFRQELTIAPQVFYGPAYLDFDRYGRVSSLVVSHEYYE